jgi:uncharacterized protein
MLSNIRKKMTLKYCTMALSACLALCFLIFSALNGWNNTYASVQAKKIQFKEFWIFFSKPDISLKVKIADTNARKMQGLMHVRALGSYQGMLFFFDAEEKHCFWMKNTYIPLSIAFLDNDKKIVDIQNMQPLSTEHHCSNSKARYALEVNQGWFEKKNLEVGDRVHF